MTRLRRSFTDEFKREAVALLQMSGRPLMQIASELGIPAVDVAQVTQCGPEGACGGIAAPGANVRLYSVFHPYQRRAEMTTQTTSTPSSNARLPGLKALAVATAVTALAATSAWAAQHEAKPQQGQSQQM
jgi:hypothetical protein